jgi:hypothetical protein
MRIALLPNAVTCEGCYVAYDGDPIARKIHQPIFGLSPEMTRIIRDFWLCPECEPNYPKGLTEFYDDYYLTPVPRCARGCGDEVDYENWVCDYCEDGVI